MSGPSRKPRRDDPPRPAEATASYFLGLTLTNYRCFGEPAQALDLSDGSGRPARWTILLGENGLGKTTVLQSLKLSEAWLRGFITGPSTPEIIRERNVVIDYATDSIRLGIDHAELATDLATGPGLELSNGAYYKKSLSLSIYYNSVGTSDYPSDHADLPFCLAYGASRRAGQSSLGGDPIAGPSLSLFFDDAELIDTKEWLLRLDYAAAKAPESHRVRQRLEQVKALLIEVLPDVKGIRCKVEGDVIPRGIVEFETPFGWVPLRGLGYGYRTLIAWTIDLVARLIERYPESDNPLAEPAVVLVDEIDLHLHPTWQRKLIADLTRLFPNTQFIVTAHSPLIVQAAGEDANIALLRREGDHVVIENDLDYIKGWRVDQILTSDLFKLPSARPPEYDAILDEQKKLLSKPKLTKADQKRLKEIEAKVDALPYGESSAQVRKMMDLIEETQRLLRKPPGRTKA